MQLINVNELDKELRVKMKFLSDERLCLTEDYNDMSFALNHQDIIKRCDEIIELKKLYYKSIDSKTKSEARKFVADNRSDLLELHNNKCYVCNLSFIPMLQIHHIKPLKDGGTNDLKNLTVLCPNCHKLIHLFISNNFLNDGVDNGWINEHFTISQNIRFMKLIQKGLKYNG